MYWGNMIVKKKWINRVKVRKFLVLWIYIFILVVNYNSKLVNKLVSKLVS